MKVISFRQIIKEAGPKERDRAHNTMNWDFASKELGEGQHPKEEIKKYMEKNPSLLLLKETDLSLIESLNLKEDRKKRVSADEAFFIIFSAALSSNSRDAAQEKLELVEWYLENKELKPGNIKEGWISKDQSALTNKESALKVWDIFIRDITKIKSDSEKMAADTKESEYLSNDIVHDFGDGWKVVYVPAVGEIAPFPGLLDTSHDRILEGNKNGLCLGSGMRLYQDNYQGEIYSVRDQNNKPRVTIRIQSKSLEEAKGKNNLSPDIPAAKKAKEWFEIMEQKDGLNFRNNYDYTKFPPLTIEEANSSFSNNSDEFITSGWAVHWYKNGVTDGKTTLDSKIMELVSSKNPIILSSGLNKKYAELVEPVFVHYAELYAEHNEPTLLPRSNEAYVQGYQQIFESEFWKTYKKNQAIFKAIKAFSIRASSLFLQVGIPKVDAYKSLIRKDFFVSDIKNKELKLDLAFKLIEEYPELKDTYVLDAVFSKPEDMISPNYHEGGHSDETYENIDKFEKYSSLLSEDVLLNVVSILIETVPSIYCSIANKSPNLLEGRAGAILVYWIKEKLSGDDESLDDIDDPYEYDQKIDTDRFLGSIFSYKNIVDKLKNEDEDLVIDAAKKTDFQYYHKTEEIHNVLNNIPDSTPKKELTISLGKHNLRLYLDLLKDDSFKNKIDSSQEIKDLISKWYAEEHPQVYIQNLNKIDNSKYDSFAIANYINKMIFNTGSSLSYTINIVNQLISDYPKWKEYIIESSKNQIQNIINYADIYYLKDVLNAKKYSNDERYKNISSILPWAYDAAMLRVLQTNPDTFFGKFFEKNEPYEDEGIVSDDEQDIAYAPYGDDSKKIRLFDIYKPKVINNDILDAIIKFALEHVSNFGKYYRQGVFKDLSTALFQRMIQTNPTEYEWLKTQLKRREDIILPENPMITVENKRASDLIYLLNIFGFKKEASDIKKLTKI